MRHLCLLFVDVDLLPPRSSRRIGHHLRMTAPIERNKQEGCLIDRSTAGNHTVVLQNYTAAGWTEGLGNASPFFSGENGASVARIHSQIVVEAQGVLIQHFNGPRKAGECLSVDGVCVACGIQVWASFMDFTVDGECGSIDGMLGASGENFAILVDEDEVRNFDHGKVHAEWVDPEVAYCRLC